jgi:hypothetical protein
VSRNTFEEIKQIVFAKKVGDCLSVDGWRQLYAEGSKALPLDHLTSCPQCLDIVNRLLGLPTLNERHPFDTINRDSDNDGTANSTKNKDEAGQDSVKRPDTNKAALRQQLEKARLDQFSDKPEEITLCINGWPFVSRLIQSKSNTLTLRPQIGEPLESLELLDEKGQLLCHFLIDEQCSEGKDEDWRDIILSPHQKVGISITWIDNYPEIYIEYCDKRRGDSAPAPSLFQKILNRLYNLQGLLSLRNLMLTTTAALLFVSIGLVLLMMEQSRRETITSLQRELEASKFERGDLTRRLADEQARRQTAEAERERIASELEQRRTPAGLPEGEESAQKVAAASSPIKLRLLQGSDDTDATLLFNTRAIMAPIALQRGEQTRIAIRLPRYDENQVLFKSYLIELSIPGQPPVVARLIAPETSTDPLFFILEAVIGNTIKLEPNTKADAFVYGVLGQKRARLGHVPLIFE